MKINKTILQILFVIVGLALLTACQSSSSNNGALAEAYKNLYDAVKSKNTENIKANMSKNTIALAEMSAEMQKKDLAEVFKNGFTETTLADKMPPVRNERIKEDMGALEVQSPKGNWEDLPFILEDGRWKLAVGDLFKGNYKKPAPSQAETEANNNVPQVVPGGADITNVNSRMPNMNAAPKIPGEKKQTEANKPEKK
ncbi:MAG: hypothetical protein M3209_03455 [Acidobacteriota bacterium]|nr:hypothetical protein [Acidobacteriota bacterium]